MVWRAESIPSPLCFVLLGLTLSRLWYFVLWGEGVGRVPIHLPFYDFILRVEIKMKFAEKKHNRYRVDICHGQFFLLMTIKTIICTFQRD